HGSRTGKADGEGRLFQFYLSPSPRSPNPRATAALLAVASLFDHGIPDTVLARCAGDDARHRGEDRRYPRALILASATVQILILLAAVVFGMRVIRPAREDDGANQPAPRPSV